ncbi:MAG: amidohydrolase/deacetylase family metallohydrolase [Alphaproteobacteria bacterium]
MTHDLAIIGGRIIDPANGRDEVTDIAFTEGKVTAIGSGLAAKETIQAEGLIVTPGLIDLHTHIYWGGTSLGVDPDKYMAATGCTTLVDAGSAGPANFHGFRAHIVEPSASRILAYINASFAGIFAFSPAVMVGESGDIRLLNPDEVVRVGNEHRDIIVGVKVRVGLVASGGIGVAPLDIAIEAADALGLPVMAHLDHPPPSRMEVLSRLRPGDVLTHCYRPFPAAPTTADGRVRDEVQAAKDMGVIFDIGHGKGSFSWQVAEAMMAAGLPPDCISSDVHTMSEVGPAFDQLVTMSKFLHLGMDLAEIIRAVTIAPANAMVRPELGGLAVGGPGDATLMRIQDGAFPLADAKGVTVEARRRFGLAGYVREGGWNAPNVRP